MDAIFQMYMYITGLQMHLAQWRIQGGGGGAPKIGSTIF